MSMLNATSTPDELRTLAYTGIYLLPGAVEAGMPVRSDDADLAGLTTEQRDRVLNIALRRLAFQLLYELDQSASAKGSPEVIDAAVRESLRGVHDIGPVHAETVRVFVTGAVADRETADAEFRVLAPEWPTHRLAAVDRALLRLAHHELHSGRTPGKIVVNEAVELAKHFSTEKAPGFINALLDKVLNRAEGEGQAGTGEGAPA